MNFFVKTAKLDEKLEEILGDRFTQENSEMVAILTPSEFEMLVDLYNVNDTELCNFFETSIGELNGFTMIVDLKKSFTVSLLFEEDLDEDEMIDIEYDVRDLLEDNIFSEETLMLVLNKE